MLVKIDIEIYDPVELKALFAALINLQDRYLDTPQPAEPASSQLPDNTTAGSPQPPASTKSEKESAIPIPDPISDPEPAAILTPVIPPIPQEISMKEWVRKRKTTTIKTNKFTCVQCGNEFTGKYKNSKFCSKKCSNANYRNPPKKAETPSPQSD